MCNINVYRIVIIPKKYYNTAYNKKAISEC